MTVVVGVSLKINENKLTRQDSGDSLSQRNLVLAHETLARNTWNWVVAYYSKYLELRNEHVNSLLLAYCGDDEVKLEAFNDAAKWVAAKKKVTSFVFPSLSEVYRKGPSVAEVEKAVTDSAKRKITVKQIVITVQEALNYYEFRKNLYSSFDAEYGRALDLFHERELEVVLSQLNRSAQDTSMWFDGQVLYNRYSDKIVEPKNGKPGSVVKKSPLPQWAIEFLIEQEETHPAAKYANGRLQVPLYLSHADDAEPSYYPAHRRVMVKEITNAALAIKKHATRFFEGGNPKQGAPRFRKFNDNQTFELIPFSNQDSLFFYEKPNFEKRLSSFAAEYAQQEGKNPNKEIQKQWKKAYEEEWYAAHPLRTLTSVSTINLPELGKVTVNSHGIRRLHKLLNFLTVDRTTGEVKVSGGKLGSNMRVSRRGEGLFVSFSVIMPDFWKKERPESYYRADVKKVGVDVGVIDSAILSTGYSFSNVSRNSRHESHSSTEPRTVQEKAFKRAMAHEQSAYENLKALEQKLEKLQQKASSIYDTKLKENDGQHKGVKALLPQSWHTLQKQIKRTHNKITNIRDHHRNVIAKMLASNFDFIGIEDLNITGLISKNHTKTDDLGNYLPNGQSSKKGMNKAMSAVGLGELLTLIQQKAVFYNTEVQLVDRWYASSLLCSGCGEKKDKSDLSLSEREYHCEKCGLTIGRDHNAAINILKAAELLQQGNKIPVTDIVSFEQEVKQLEQYMKTQKLNQAV